MTAAPLWTAGDAAAAAGGRTTGCWTAAGVSIDSRTLRGGDMFVALAGPNFDGHAFVGQAFEAGAAAAVVSRPPAGGAPRGPLLVVDDALAALRGLAAAARRRTGARIAAVTGSVGKTGVKEALAHALGGQGETCASRGNLNNHWGAPLSLARMPAGARFGVFEMGMNHAGEIAPLSRLARPHVAVVTAVAAAHMAHFRSLDDVARAKAEIFQGLEGGVAVVNRDDPRHGLLAAAAKAAGAGRVVGFGRHPEADMRVVRARLDEDGTDAAASWRGGTAEFRIGLPGDHWVANALAVLAAADGLGADVAAAAAALATLPPMPGRGTVRVVPWDGGTIRLIDDSYNANPESMRAALDALGRTAPAGGRRVAVLGDMLELGAFSRDAHAGLGRHVERNGVDLVYLAGPEIRALADVLGRERIGGAADDAEGLLPLVASGLAPGDVVVVKASRGVGLDRIVDGLLSGRGAG